MPNPEASPDITCIIPTYNDRINLRRAVDSALSQKGVNVEVLLVDDQSDSPTREYIAALAQSDPRIVVFLLPDNGGQGRSRNIGGMLARGRYLTFLDQDDEHAPGWYESATTVLDATPSLGLLSGRASIIEIPARLGIDETDLRVRGLNLVFTANIILRRSVFLASGGFPIGPIWRSKVAGEDGVYRQVLAQNWSGGQTDWPALIHRAKEGGATVYFLDRSAVEGDRVVMTELAEIVRSGEMLAAHEAMLARARRIALEIRACIKPPPGPDPLT